jgi:thymidylate synthase (FAD)|nr:MAG TPA: Thymidylate synthase complementing protein [Caudoviricetes sp.]
MNFIQPKVEWWQQKNLSQHIARVGRICYKAKGAQPDANMSADEMESFIQKRDERRCFDFWLNGHRSMFRHGTKYFFMESDKGLPKYIWTTFYASPFIEFATKNHKVWISANMQFLRENAILYDALMPFEVNENKFISKAVKANCTDALECVRMTMVVTTQISTSRELNRTSPNSIAEQSTRYCNLEKKGGVQIARPHWFFNGSLWQRLVYGLVCRVCEWGYNRLLASGLKPEDARGCLPLDTYTVVAYTYSVAEWRRILDLRFYGSTGKPHPNACFAAEKIHDIILSQMRKYYPEFTI